MLRRRGERSTQQQPARLHGYTNTADTPASGALYPASVFVAALLLLERAADAFIHSVSLLSSQLGISPTLIALLTAGAEWEELVVVVAALAHGSSNLAIANVVGSAIANILGAFSLGIIAAPNAIQFDASSRRFAIIHAAITTLVIALLLTVQLQHADTHAKLATQRLFENVVGLSLITIFVLYFVGLSWAIGRGMLAAPQPSDSESGSESADDSSSSSSSASASPSPSTYSDASSLPPARTRTRTRAQAPAARRSNPRTTATATALESTPLLVGSATSSNLAARLARRRRRAQLRSLRNLVAAFLLLSLAGYLLSHSVLDLASLLHLSDSLLGLTLLSFATTIPEKLLSVVAGLRSAAPSKQPPPPPSTSRPTPSIAPAAQRSPQRAQNELDIARSASSVLMAAATGSNIFLLTLCLGISLLFDRDHPSPNPLLQPTSPPHSHHHPLAASSVQWQELALLEVASLFLVLIAFTDAQRWQGLLLLLAYFAFLVFEFTYLRR